MLRKFLKNSMTKSASNSCSTQSASTNNITLNVPPKMYVFDKQNFDINHLSKFALAYHYFIETYNIKYRLAVFQSADRGITLKQITIKLIVADNEYITKNNKNWPIDFNSLNVIINSLIQKNFQCGLSQMDMIIINKIWKNIKTNAYIKNYA